MFDEKRIISYAKLSDNLNYFITF